MAKDLLFEIGTEELPASAVEVGLKQLKEAGRVFGNYRLDYREIEAKASPRRLVLMVKGLVERQEKIVHETRGPAKHVAFENKKPTPAAHGFAKAQGVSVDSLITKETPQGEYVFAVKEEEGRLTSELLSGILKEIALSLSFPKSMRWEGGDLRFSRPIRWLLALWGSELISLELDGIMASNKTWGHRFLCKENPLTVKSAGQYEDLLEKKGKVIVDVEKRKELILKKIKEVAAGRGGRPVIDEGTFREVIHLVEHPGAIYGSFPEAFLVLPREVLVTAMEAHQRYFPVEGEEGNLKAGFVAVHNGDEKHADIITRGHERVLRARLSDAKFFFEEDQKKTLSERTEDLKGVVFQERLGSLYQKVMRVQRLSALTAEKLAVDDQTKSQAERAAYLCKSDLLTDMVVEFPVLQGVMGREYALLCGEPLEVAAAIYEHYLPRSATDQLPSTSPGKIVSIADKLDTIAGCISVGLIPTGSEDPYALRRQAQGIVTIILNSEFTLSLSFLLSASLDMFQEQGVKFDREASRAEIEALFSQRMRQTLLSEGLSYDVADAVLTLGVDNLVDLKRRAQAMSEFRSGPEMENLLTAYNRCKNLVRAEAGTVIAIGPSFDLYTEEQERRLGHAWKDVDERVEEALRAGEFEGALKALAYLRPEVDRFFDDVLVMVDDARLRENRLALLRAIVGTFNKVADFSKIVVGGT